MHGERLLESAGQHGNSEERCVETEQRMLDRNDIVVDSWSVADKKFNLPKRLAESFIAGVLGERHNFRARIVSSFDILVDEPDGKIFRKPARIKLSVLDIFRRRKKRKTIPPDKETFKLLKFRSQKDGYEFWLALFFIYPAKGYVSWKGKTSLTNLPNFAVLLVPVEAVTHEWFVHVKTKRSKEIHELSVEKIVEMAKLKDTRIVHVNLSELEKAIKS